MLPYIKSGNAGMDDMLYEVAYAACYTKAYPHGIRYLKKLDKLAETVSGWKEFNSHEAFKEQILQAHGRKRSFWSKYEAVYADENIWLTQKMMATLYDVDVRTVYYHLKKIFSDSELQEDSVIRNFRITAVERNPTHIVTGST